MNKAILIIDMPEHCGNCKIVAEDYMGLFCCHTGDRVEETERGENCPLQELLEQNQISTGYDMGK